MWNIILPASLNPFGQDHLSNHVESALDVESVHFGRTVHASWAIVPEISIYTDLRNTGNAMQDQTHGASSPVFCL